MRAGRSLWFPTTSADHTDYKSGSHEFWVPVERPPLLAIVPGQLDFNCAGETRTITLASALDWTATSDADWVSVMETSGGKTGDQGETIHITVDPNNSGTERTATVTLRSTDGREEQVLNVFQSRYLSRPGRSH